MNRLGRASVLAMLGIVTGSLLINGGYGAFVQQRMFIPLLLAAVVLAAFAVHEVYHAIRAEKSNPEAHWLSFGPAVGWLMVLPLVVLFAVAPSALGAAAANRVDAFNPTEQTEAFPELDSSSGAVEMRVFDFLDRALWDPDQSLRDVPVRLEGLVVNDPDVPDGFLLTKFMVSCCAADGLPLQVAVRGVDQVLEDDTWVEVDVIWREPEIPYADAGDVVVVDADAISVTPQPDARKDPYESPY